MSQFDDILIKETRLSKTEEHLAMAQAWCCA